MRRSILKNNNIIISLCFVALFTGLSFIFDQRVVQQENTIRDFKAKISNSEINLQKNIFLLNSLFFIAKEISYSGQIKKNTMDDTSTRGPWFKDYVNNPDFIEDINPLKNGQKGFEDLSKVHKEIFIDVLKANNKKVTLVKNYLKIFMKNKAFIDIINDEDFDPYVIKADSQEKFYFLDIEKFYFTEEEINNIPFDVIVPWESRGSDKDPLYKIYSKFRDRIHEFSNIGDDMHAIALALTIIHKDSFKSYKKLLINFSKTKNRKNYFILLSILFQILGLTSLMILFKIVINQEKK